MFYVYLHLVNNLFSYRFSYNEFQKKKNLSRSVLQAPMYSLVLIMSLQGEIPLMVTPLLSFVNAFINKILVFGIVKLNSKLRIFK